tara:strand:+ start:3510 stop:4499 length:990 start_codon:yes stop_codon:yes gene_type:complete
MKNKKILITGGTGSFGSKVLEKLLNTNISEIRVFSRDEKKQEDLRISVNNEKVKFFIGDVRDFQSISNAMWGVDYVFHAAALKQVPSCEFFPMEAYKTNVVGTANTLDAAIQNKVESVVCLSTDKAVYPINAMGISKAMMEKLVQAKARNSKYTRISITRYGNVIGSRGSVIPLFLDLIKKNKPLTITSPSMTRFLMTLDQSVDLVLFALQNGKNGELFIKKSPASNIENLAKAVKKFTGENDWPIVTIGKRHGEKDFESLLNVEEKQIAIDRGDYFEVQQDLRDLNYHSYISKGNKELKNNEDYNSNNTEQLNIDEIVNLFELAQLKK